MNIYFLFSRKLSRIWVNFLVLHTLEVSNIWHKKCLKSLPYFNFIGFYATKNLRWFFLKGINRPCLMLIHICQCSLYQFLLPDKILQSIYSILCIMNVVSKINLIDLCFSKKLKPYIFLMVYLNFIKRIWYFQDTWNNKQINSWLFYWSLTLMINW